MIIKPKSRFGEPRLHFSQKCPDCIFIFPGQKEDFYYCPTHFGYKGVILRLDEIGTQYHAGIASFDPIKISQWTEYYWKDYLTTYNILVAEGIIKKPLDF